MGPPDGIFEPSLCSDHLTMTTVLAYRREFDFLFDLVILRNDILGAFH